MHQTSALAWLSTGSMKKKPKYRTEYSAHVYSLFFGQEDHKIIALSTRFPVVRSDLIFPLTSLSIIVDLLISFVFS